MKKAGIPFLLTILFIVGSVLHAQTTEAEYLRYSAIVDYTVENNDGTVTGQIIDLILTDDGRVPYAVVRADVFLDYDADSMLVPLEAIDFIGDQRALFTMNLEESDLADIQLFDYYSLAYEEEEAWDDDVVDFWRRRVGAQIQGAGTVPYLASEVAEYTVVNPDGEESGEVEDFMIHIPGKQVAYVAVSTGGILGIGDELYAVPLDAALLDDEAYAFVLKTELQELGRAGQFSGDSWPEELFPELDE